MQNIIQFKRLHDRLFKKEPISPIEKIYDEYNPLKDNVVRRPANQCLGNLKYSNIHFDPKSNRYYRKDKPLKEGNNFIITDDWKTRVNCFIIWNFGFGRYMPYNDFVDAMYYDYLRFGRISDVKSNKVKFAERKSVERYVRSQIDELRDKGYKVFRDEFEKERPDLFVGEKRKVFRCLNPKLSREEKIKACHKHKRQLRINTIDSFANMIKKHPATVNSWFDTKKDSEGFNRICFSEKAVNYLNKRIDNKGLPTLSEDSLFKMFCARNKKRFGKNNKNYNIKTFIDDVLMSADTEEIILKAIKKIKNEKILKIHNRTLVKYRKVAAHINSMLEALVFREGKSLAPPIAS